MADRGNEMLHPRLRTASGRACPGCLVIDDEDMARYLVAKLLSGLPAEVQKPGGERKAYSMLVSIRSM